VEQDVVGNAARVPYLLDPAPQRRVIAGGRRGEVAGNEAEAAGEPIPSGPVDPPAVPVVERRLHRATEAVVVPITTREAEDRARLG
jgi:hypothetical protein